MKKFKVISWLMLSLLVANLFLPFKQVFAAKRLENAVTGMTVSTYDNVLINLNSPQTFLQGSPYVFGFNFDLRAYDNQLEDGDYFDFNVPAPLTVTPGTFDVLYKGHKVGTGTVTANGPKLGGTVRITLDDLDEYKAAHNTTEVTDVVGEFFIRAQFDDLQNTNRTLEFGDVTNPNNRTLNYRVVGRTGGNLGVNNEVLFKGGGTITARNWQSNTLNKTGDVLHPWALYLNRAQHDFGTLSVVDEIETTDGVPVQFIPEHFKLYRVSFASGSRIYTRLEQLQPIENYVTFSNQYTKFTLNIPNASVNQYVLEYSTTGPNNGMRIGNSATVYDNGQVKKPFDSARVNTLTSIVQSYLRQGGQIAVNFASRIYVLKVDETDLFKPLPGAEFEVTGPNGFKQRYTTGPDGSLLTDQLQAGTYTVTEVLAPEGYELPDDPSFTVRVTATGIVRTVKNKPARTTSFTATKTWVDGPAAKPTVAFVLQQNGVDYTGPDARKELPAGTTSVTWNNLPVEGRDGVTYTYTVREEPVANYTASYSPDGSAVTNTYTPNETTVVATKQWVNGPAVKPTVSVQLFRNGQAFGQPKQIVHPATTAEWTQLPETDNQGNPYTYTVDEVDVPAGYEKQVAGNTIINTFVQEMTTFTARKVWLNGPATKPTVTFVLQQDGVDYAGADATKTLPNGTTSVTWDNLPKTDLQGNPHVYTVREVPVANYTPSYNAAKDEVTNTYVSPTTTVSGRKVWVDGPAEKPTIQVQLKRNGENYRAPISLANGTTTFSWTDLPETDEQGNPYTYTVDEVSVPANYTKSVNGTTITNTFTPNKVSYTVNKVWDGGPTPRPSVQFQLLKDGAAEGAPVQLNDGETTYTWANLDETDNQGNPHVYEVVEVNTPAGYAATTTTTPTSSTVTNTYVIPTTSFTADKVWNGGPAAKPTVTFVLQQDGVDYNGADAQQLLPNGTTSVTWNDLPATDRNGVPYTYSVRELPVADYNTTYNGTTVTNTYESPIIPVTAQKVWVNGPTPRPSIQFQLKRNGQDFGAPVTLADGETSYTWQVEQTDANGVPYTYTVSELQTPANYTKNEQGLTVINTYEVPLGEVKATLAWEGVDGTKPTVRYQLKRNGLPVGDPVTLTDGDDNHVWTNVPLTDENGVPYTYTVEQLDLPNDFESVNQGLHIINRKKPQAPAPKDDDDNDDTPSSSSSSGPLVIGGDQQLPNTGENHTIWYITLGVIFIGLALLALKPSKRQS